MGYRLTKKELRIIEQTKLEGREDAPGEAAEAGRNGKPATRKGIVAALKPYLFFAGLVLFIVLAISLLLYFTARS